MTRAAVDAIRAYLTEYFPHAERIEALPVGDMYHFDVVTPTRDYRLSVTRALVDEKEPGELVGRCHSESVAWRLADTTRLVMTADATHCPPPDDMPS